MLRRSSTVPRCTIEGCAAGAAIVDNGVVRLHNLHALNAIAQLAARLGPAGFAAYLETDGYEREREWARVLRERLQRAA